MAILVPSCPLYLLHEYKYFEGAQLNLEGENALVSLLLDRLLAALPLLGCRRVPPPRAARISPPLGIGCATLRKRAPAKTVRNGPRAARRRVLGWLQASSAVSFRGPSGEVFGADRRHAAA